jgi:hypothetical protein
MRDTWQELDDLCTEVQALNATWAERRTRLETELDALRPILDLLDRYHAELAAETALDAVRTRLLGGAGVIQQTSAAFGLERLAVLAWPASADPRPDLSGATGEYRVEVWLGVNEQGRARVRVVGAKRLEAVLPVPVEKFRAVLLGAIRAPAFTPYPTDQEAPSAAPVHDTPQASSPPAAPAPEHAAARPHTEPPADQQQPDDSGLTPPGQER